MDKTQWTSTLTSVQPRIRLSRSFDQQSHSYLGYVLRVDGEEREFLVAIGKAQLKHRFRVGDSVSGVSFPVPDPQLELAEFYKTSQLKVIERSSAGPATPPPWTEEPPDLDIYRERGHRRLDARTYETKCRSCKWGSRMAVEMIVDHWNPQKKKYRFETFCYGPKSCPFYRAGATRKVPGRKGMSWEEEDWIDEDATSHRAGDE